MTRAEAHWYFSIYQYNKPYEKYLCIHIYQNVPEAHWPVYQVENQEHYWENHQEDIVHLMMVMMTMTMIKYEKDNDKF